MATCPVDRFRDGVRAVAFARESCEISNWQDAWFITVLAAAYAEAGDFKRAIHWQEKGIEIEQDEDGIQAMKELLKLYRSGSSYRRKPAWNILSKLFGEFA